MQINNVTIVTISKIIIIKTMSNRNHTKQYILLALFALMQKMDYEEISVKDICTRAGVSRMSFYRYYSKKDDVFINYCDERFEEFYGIIQDKGITSFKELTLEAFRFIKRYSRQINVLIQAHREFMLLEQLNSYARFVIMNFKNDFLSEQKKNPLFCYFIAGGLYNTTMYWVTNEIKSSPEELNDMFYKMIEGKMDD